MNTTGWFSEVIRPFLAGIDVVVYKFISWVMASIFNLASLTVNGEFARILYNRVYTILAIFMVFKLSFSFIKYLVSPELMTDKEQGVGKLIARTVIMLALIVFLPNLFFNSDLTGGKGTVLTVLQEGVLKTLPKLIMGINDEDPKAAKEDSEQIALMMLSAFYYPSGCSETATTCDIANTHKLDSLDSFRNSITTEHPSNGKYQYEYMWPLTTIAGVVLLVILLGIAVDVAIRVFKLLLLQVMAPVPIMSYIDPKSSKDGAFSNWLHSFITTYIEIFVKIGSVYLIILLLTKTFNVDPNTEGLFSDWDTKVGSKGFLDKTFIYVFLIIGLFKFAKDAPKFIKDALGIKDSGGGMFGGLSALGAAAGLAGGAAIGAAGGAIGGYNAARASGHGVLSSVFRGLGGGAAGLTRGGYEGGKGAAKGNLFKGIGSAAAAQNAVTQRKLAAMKDGSTLFGRLGASGSQFFTGQNAADRDEQRLADFEEEKTKFDTLASAHGNLYDYIMDKGMKKGASTDVGVAFRGGTLTTSYDAFNTAYQTAKSKGATTFAFRDAVTGSVYSMATNSGEAAALASDIQKASATAWANANSSDSALQQYEKEAGVYNGYYTASDLKNIKEDNEQESRRVADEIYRLKTSDGYKTNKANAAAVKRNSK